MDADPVTELGDTEQQFESSSDNQEKSTVDTDEQRSVEDAKCCLTALKDSINKPLIDEPTARYLMEEAQQLVDFINKKRTNDAQLLEEFRAALELQSKKMYEEVEQQLYQTYKTQSAQVDERLQELFVHLDHIETADVELTNFKESLRKLYQDMHSE